MTRRNPDETDKVAIQACAWRFIARFGYRANQEARRRADELLHHGHLEGRTRWLLVASEIDSLLFRPRPDLPITSHPTKEGKMQFAKDIMTPNVITVSPESPVNEIALLLVDRRISGVPVISRDGTLLGMVSEGDFLHRAQESEPHAPRSWWLKLFGDPDDTPKNYLKSHGRTAEDIMTRNVISVSPVTTVGQIAEILERNRIKRVPVVDGGRLVGIVSRANILQALAAIGESAVQSNAQDADIRDAILNEVGGHPWADDTTLNVVVANGVATLWGYVDNEDVRQAVRVAAENTPGIKSVEDNIIVARIPSGYV